MRLFILLLILGFSSLSYTQTNITEAYIGKYKQISIHEMNRTGIPASITLAQGLLESNWGRSNLAVKSNNHFGIKCSGDYSGKKHLRYDDEYNKLGKKKKSCFRVYDSAEDSFYDHSEFLTDKNKHKRYGFLFEFASSDYRSWAKGLSKSGYASDPKYASKLISIIKKHELWRYDEERGPFTDDQIVKIETIEKDHSYKITYLNSCKIVLAKGGESVKILASSIGVSSRSIVKHNTGLSKKGDLLDAGQKVYLEKKKRFYLGKEKEHILGNGENIANISNKYGISEDFLRKINRLSKKEELSRGDVAKLKYSTPSRYKQNKRTVKPKEEKNLLADNSNYLFEKALQPFRK